MIAYEDICIKEQPDIVLVVDDVNSTVACSLATKKIKYQSSSCRAGLGSGDMEMAKEINRIVTDSITDYYFVTEQSGVDNLLAEGKPKENIHFVGHVMIDNIFYQVEKLKSFDPKKLAISIKLKEEYPEYGVVTLHRPSHVDDIEIFSGIIEALSEVSQKLPLIFIIHPRTKKTLNHLILNCQIRLSQQMRFLRWSF